MRSEKPSASTKAMTTKARKIIERVIRELGEIKTSSGVSGVATALWADELQIALDMDEAGEAESVACRR